MQRIQHCLLLFLFIIPLQQFAQQKQAGAERMLQALKQSGMVKQEGNHITFKVKKASDTPQIKMMYGAFFASDKWTIGFDIDGKYFDSRKKPDPSVLFTKDKEPKKETPVYTAKPVTTTVGFTRLATADEAFLQSGSFLIRTARDYRYLTIRDNVPVNNSPVFVNSFVNNPDRQQWKLVLQNDGFFKIQSENGLCLAQNIIPMMEPSSNTDKQLWRLEDTGDGYYTIQSKANYFLYLHERRNRENGVVGFRNTNTTIEEKWHLIRWTNDGRRVTSFIPETHGFRFTNTFRGEDAIRWGGLCGGMVYTALDYFNQRIPVPLQFYTPANRTTLQSYIYGRQEHSIWDVNSTWSELEVAYNTRAAEIFRWGLQGTGGGRLEELKNSIDANTSRPIGLFAGGVRGKDDSDGGRHVVLGVGYAMGRYRGDMGAHKEDYKIFTYNPNEGNILRTLVPDLRVGCYFEVETGKAWRTYFVNHRYDGSHVPPRDIPNFPEGEPEGSVRHLYATFFTGGDDLRGGNDNVSITIKYTDGTEQLFSNVNIGARWIDNGTETIHLALNRAVRKQDIRYFMLTVSFGTDDFSDDWNLDAFRVSSGHNGVWYAWADPPAGSQYVYRFSGDQRTIRHVIHILP